MLKPTVFLPPELAAICFATPGCQTTATAGRFDRADANHDGQLSRDEVNIALVTRVFETRDANHDNRMTKAEWLVAEDAGQDKIFRVRDADHDGVVTLDEAVAYRRKNGMADKTVREADKGRNGFVSRAEMNSYYGSKEGSPD